MFFLSFKPVKHVTLGQAFRKHVCVCMYDACGRNTLSMSFASLGSIFNKAVSVTWRVLFTLAPQKRPHAACVFLIRGTSVDVVGSCSLLHYRDSSPRGTAASTVPCSVGQTTRDPADVQISYVLPTKKGHRMLIDTVCEKRNQSLVSFPREVFPSSRKKNAPSLSCWQVT